MQKQLLLSVLAIGVASAGVGMGTFAFFSDTGQSTGNIFRATTLDLHLNDAEDVTGTITDLSFSPGDDVSGTITLKNAGTIEDAKIDLDLAFDVSTTDKDAGSTDIQKFLKVTELKVGTRDLLAGSETCWAGAAVADSNGNGRIDLGDIDTQTCVDLASPAGGATFSIKVEFTTDAGNSLQGDSADLTLRFLLAQTGASDITA